MSESYSFVIRSNNTNLEEFTRQGQTYVSMKDGACYVVWIHNRTPKNCDAILTIDGEDMGRFRVNANGSVYVQRPVQRNFAFRFVKDKNSGDEQEGGQAGTTNTKNGLVEVLFKPSKFNAVDAPNESVMVTSNYPATDNTSTTEVKRSVDPDDTAPDLGSPDFDGSMDDVERYERGGTIFDTPSNNIYTLMADLTYDEESTFVTKTLRMVVDNSISDK